MSALKAIQQMNGCFISGVAHGRIGLTELRGVSEGPEGPEGSECSGGSGGSEGSEGSQGPEGS